MSPWALAIALLIVATYVGGLKLFLRRWYGPKGRS